MICFTIDSEEVPVDKIKVKKAIPCTTPEASDLSEPLRLLFLKIESKVNNEPCSYN